MLTRMAARADLIAVVESCYDLAATDLGWLRAIANGFQTVLRPEEGLLAYHIDVEEGSFRLYGAVQSDATPRNMVARIQAMGALLERKRTGRAGLIELAKATIYERVGRSAIREPADRLVQSEYRRLGPDWMYTLAAPIEDTFSLISHHIDENGFTCIMGGLAKKRTFRPAERVMYQMLSAHLKAGLRLRRRLPRSESVEAPASGAVLSSSGRVLHAEGDAREGTDELADAAKRIDRARSRRLGRGEDALAIWQGLVQGQWSLVEAFDRDGKRFILAHRNPEDVRDPRGLSEMETRVVGLAVRGYADKLIAYHLGISEGTASSHLTHALRKLKIGSRVELVRRLGTRYPQPDL